MSGAPLRLGILGAARIAPAAVVEPARRSGRVRVVAIAARDAARAQRFADAHGAPPEALRVLRDYDALIDDAEIDAVYVALPAALHARWTSRALGAGKHVLCEKPFASNADEAVQMVDAATRADRVLLEAFHYRFHPLAERVRAIVTSGELGRIRDIEATFTVAVQPGNIRHDLALGGGALMDLGCYPVHWARLVAAAEPTVISAEATLAAPGVDMVMTADLAFTAPDGGAGAHARIHCSMALDTERKNGLRVRGESGELDVDNLLAPHSGHLLSVRGPGGQRTEQVAGKRTYDHQLEAFAAAVLDGGPRITGGADAIANMRVIDAIYRAAGMSPRGEASARLP